MDLLTSLTDKAHTTAISFINSTTSYAMTFNSDIFKYFDISPTENQIRVLELDPTSNSFGALTCSLVAVSLDDPGLRFDAVSYRWANDKSMAILVNNQKLFVSHTVYAILRSLESDHNFEPRCVWIDSICIDQSNQAEKQWQIGLMQRVYSQAERVVAWMGDSSSSKGALTYAAKLLASATTGSDREMIEAWEMRRPIGECDARWSTIQALLKEDWFGRVWVIQEVTLAKDLIVRHGSGEQIPWDTLAEFGQFLFMPQVEPRLRDPRKDNFGIDKTLYRNNSVINGMYCTTATHKTPHVQYDDDIPYQIRFRGSDFDKVVSRSGFLDMEAAENRSDRMQVIAEFFDFVNSCANLCVDGIRRQGLLKGQFETPLDLFWRTALMDRTQTGECPIPVATLEEFKATCMLFQMRAGSSGSGILPPTDPVQVQELDMGLRTMFMAIGSSMGGKRLCVTDKGYLVLCPKETEIQDHVCIIYGAETPYIVRSFNGNDINPDKPNCLVGSCYVQGITNGELVSRRDISLVPQYLLFDVPPIDLGGKFHIKMSVIAVAGGTGSLGRTNMDGMINTGKIEVIVLAREANEAKSRELRARLVVVDYSNIDNVASVLESSKVDTVISTLGTLAGSDPEVALIKGADQS
ncbi:heterokaryon incompatibility protein-domain-containing protein [Pyrenochaeta sp. MPI-SDFR-AT-0127]|nr:heterokaryon incompatibility protein-domain-containing protein [Pyrenochaeta sp. MPI-SDFR-AT-0127]